MIFVIVGSQKFQFNRLLKKLDELIEQGAIADSVFAQIGESDYIPKHYPSEAFLDRTAFAAKIAESDLVITHGGTGAIVGALKQGKHVITVPRRAQYHEHVDDHQFEIIGQFGSMGMVCPCYDLKDLGEKIQEAAVTPVAPYESNTASIIQSIETFLEA